MAEFPSWVDVAKSTGFVPLFRYRELEAERDRYREALEKIRDGYAYPGLLARETIGPKEDE